MSKNAERICMICRKNKVNVTIASNGDNDCGFGPNRTVCNNFECRETAREQFINEPRRKKEKEELEKNIDETEKTKEKVKKISTHMKTGKSLSEWNNNWKEEISDLPEDIKNLCYKYQESFERKEKSSKTQQEQKTHEERCDDCGNEITGRKFYQCWDGTNGSGVSCESCTNNKQNNNSNQKRKCNKCQQHPSDGKFYTVTNTAGSYCNSCADELCEPSSNNPSPNTKNVQHDAKCQECGIEIGVGTHCSSCFEKVTGNESPSNGGKDKETWRCGNCGKNFTNKNDLDNHMRNIHGLGEESNSQSSQPILKNPLIIGGAILFFTALIAIVIKKFRHKTKRQK